MSELTTSDLAMSPPVSNADEDMAGVMFKIEESDTESRGSTATSLDSGVGGVRRERRVRTMTECEVSSALWISRHTLPVCYLRGLF